MPWKKKRGRIKQHQYMKLITRKENNFVVVMVIRTEVEKIIVVIMAELVLLGAKIQIT